MEQRPLDSSTLELCISSSGIAREMEQRPLDSSTLELCISSSGIAREMEQRPLDSSTLELCISSSGIAREMEQRPLDSSTLELQWDMYSQFISSVISLPCWCEIPLEYSTSKGRRVHYNHYIPFTGHV